MVETTSPLLQIVDMVTGGRNNTWGDILDANLVKVENAIAGTSAIASTGGATTLTDDQARPAALSFTGGLLSNHVVVVPNHSKIWLVVNGHTLGAYALTMKTAGGSAITIPAGQHIIYCDGSNVLYRAGSALVDNAGLAAMNNGTVKANISGGAANPSDVTLAQFGAAIGYLSAPVGTAMMFVQTTAPTGWTKATTHNNKALRVVSGAASSGGTVDFTTAFTAKAVAGTVGDTTLTAGQIPAHSHFTASSTTDYYTALTSSNYVARNGGDPNGFQNYTFTGGSSAPTLGLTSSIGGGGAHAHTFSGTAIDLAVAYVDVIIAVKD